jgi:DNA adenine methylase
MELVQSYIIPESDKNIKVIKDDGSALYLPNFDFTESITNNYTMRSLLRYPGGKTRAVNIILKLIPKDVKELCAPFLGGGSVELACTSKGIKVDSYDIFEPLVEFWECLLDNPIQLADEVSKYFPLPRIDFYALQKNQTFLTKKIERAAVFYVLNRASYSGSTFSGGMSPGHPRFTESSIQRLRDFFNPLITVKRLDFKDSILLHSKMFLYLDPPYLIKNNLYGKNGDTHKDFDHQNLFNILDRRDNWLLSYNNCSEILDLYKGYKILFPIWKYGMSNDKNSREILILSKDIQRYHNL